MIGKTVDRNRKTSVRHGGERVGCLQIVLASCAARNLPRRHKIAAKWIVHPFGNFMAHWRNISHAAPQDSAIHPACPDEGLHKLHLRELAYVKRGMEAENAAALDIALRSQQ